MSISDHHTLCPLFLGPDHVSFPYHCTLLVPILLAEREKGLQNFVPSKTSPMRCMKLKLTSQHQVLPGTLVSRTLPMDELPIEQQT